MTHRRKNTEILVREYLDGELPDSEHGSFLHRLRNDPGALRLMARHALMDAHIRSLGRDFALGIPTASGRQHRSGNAWRRKSWRIAAMLVLAAAVSAIIAIGGKSARVSAGYQVSAFSNYSLEGPTDVPGRLVVGATLTLTQGVADLMLPTGVRCIASAPSRITLLGRNELSIAGGLAHFEVPDSGKGFIVRTPDFEVIDHGTEFTIDSTEEGRNEAHVLRGKIEVRSRNEQGMVSTLTDGQAVRSDDGQLKPIATDTQRFPTQLPDGLPALRFSFDPDEAGRLPISGSLAESARVSYLPSLNNFPAPDQVAGRFGGALRFPSNNHSLETTWPGVEGTMARSVSFWIRSEAAVDNGGIFMPVVAWGLPAGPRLMGLFSIQLGGIPGDLRLRITSGRRWLEGATILDDGEWHHVVVVLEGHNPGEWPTIKAYVNGSPEPLVERLPEDLTAAPLETFYTVVDHPHSVPLTFGRFNQWKDYPSQPWEIDEVLIAAGILLPQQIEALWQGDPANSGLALNPSRSE
jgi:hypothetical protein